MPRFIFFCPSPNSSIPLTAMNKPGLNIAPHGTRAGRVWQFSVANGSEDDALKSLIELLSDMYDISFADHSRDDCEGAYYFGHKFGHLEYIQGGHGYSGDYTKCTTQKFAEIF